VMTVTLNRPDRLNAFTMQMASDWFTVLDDADTDDDVRAVIVTGAGRGFCAGADLSAGGATFDSSNIKGADPKKIHRDEGGLLTLRIFQCRKPIIAAVNGPAVGVGVTSILPMDIRLASTKARFGFVFARRGVVPEACSSWFLPRVVGINRAMEWVATGRVSKRRRRWTAVSCPSCSNPMRCCLVRVSWQPRSHRIRVASRLLLPDR
jgi:enoyl-CoA hydratase/carnithine racemase